MRHTLNPEIQGRGGRVLHLEVFWTPTEIYGRKLCRKLPEEGLVRRGVTQQEIFATARVGNTNAKKCTCVDDFDRKTLLLVRRRSEGGGNRKRPQVRLAHLETPF